MKAGLIPKSIFLFIAAGICEIGGGYLVWLWLRNNKGFLLGIIGGFVLFFYGVVPTFQPAHFGRVSHALPPPASNKTPGIIPGVFYLQNSCSITNFYPFLVKPILGNCKLDMDSANREVLRGRFLGSKMVF